jgi:hypothetical protein
MEVGIIFLGQIGWMDQNEYIDDIFCSVNVILVGKIYF